MATPAPAAVSLPQRGFLRLKHAHRKALTMGKDNAADLMTNEQQAELQGKAFQLFEEFRTRHGLSNRSIWFWGVAFFWGYARRLGATNEQITSSTVRSYLVNEQALTRAGGPRPAVDGHIGLT